MPRATKQVKELHDKLDQQVAQLAINGTIIAGLRKDLEGACRENRMLEQTVLALRHEANEDDQHIKMLQDEFVKLQLVHDRVCRMWATTMSQFDNVYLDKEMSA